MAYIGVDIGTSGCKAAVVSRDGDIVAAAHREYHFIIPRAGWAELDPAVIWRAVVEVLRELAPAAVGARALAVSSFGESMVLTDAADGILYNAIAYVDNRCEGTLPLIEAVIDPRRLHDLTGMPINQMYSLNKLLWLRQHRPEVLDRTKKIFLVAEYIGYLLTGNRLVDPSCASRTMLVDARALDWSPQLLRDFGVERALFADIAPSGTLVGTLLPGIARETGLPATLEIRLGGHDQPCCTLGSGAMRAGDVLMGEGSSESMNLIIDKNGLGEALLDNKIGFEPCFDGKYLLTSAQLTHGTSIRWFVELHRERIAAQRTDPAESLYAVADRLCAEASDGLFFLPYMSGVDPNDADNDARGCFVGLDLTVDVWRMYRAVLEGLNFETRMRLERLIQGGVALGNLVAAGGAAKSSFYMQMKADVIGRTIRILESGEAGIMGMGMVCAVALGDYADYAEAASHFVRIKGEFNPRTDYTRQYESYMKVQRHIRALYRDFR